VQIQKASKDGVLRRNNTTKVQLSNGCPLG
jgi:hypothetical protein